MTVDGVEYGETREYGNFSFTRVYEAGHEVPYYQPIAALALFNRTINNMDTATGTKKVTADLSTEGDAEATHTEPFVPLPSTMSSSSSSMDSTGAPDTQNSASASASGASGTGTAAPATYTGGVAARGLRERGIAGMAAAVGAMNLW